jgi:hypothetical protein
VTTGGPPISGFGEELIALNREKPICFEILHVLELSEFLWSDFFLNSSVSG